MSLRTAAPAASLACLALLIGACGGSDDEPAPTTAAPEAATEPQPAQPTATRRKLERYLGEALRARDRTQNVDVPCVIRVLRATLSNRAVDLAVAAIEAGEEPPAGVTNAAYEAGSACRKP